MGKRKYVMQEAEQKGNGAPPMDWTFVNGQVRTGSQDAVIAVGCDLGNHDQGKAVNKKGVTYVATLDEANDLVDQAEDILGEYSVQEDNLDIIEDVALICRLPFKIVKDKWVFTEKSGEDNVTFVNSEEEAEALLTKAIELDKYGNLKKDNLDTFEVMEDCFKVPFNIFEGGVVREFGILSDLTDNYVEYVEGQEPKQYRVNLCPVYNGQMRGFPIRYKDGTFDPRSVLARLCKATHNEDILKKGPDQNNIALLPGSGYFQVIERNEETGYLKVSKEFGTPRLNRDGTLKDEIAPLDIPGYPDGIFIAFDTATADELEAAKLNKLYVNRIKEALDYEGSQIQKAFEELEARRAAKANEAEPKDEGEEEEDKAPETTSKRRSRRNTKVEEPENTPESSQEAEEEETDTKVEGRSRRRPKTAEKASEPATTRGKRGRRVEKEPEPEVETDDSDGDDDIPW